MGALAACLAFGLVGGTLSGFVGIGGGAILPPLLVLVLGLSQHHAQGVSLAALLPPVGLPAVLAYRRAGIRIDGRLVVMLIPSFIVGSLVAAWVANRLPARELAIAFAATLLYSAWRGLARLRTEDVEADAEGGAGTGAPEAAAAATATGGDVAAAPAAGATGGDVAVARRWAMPIGLATGTAAGLLGVGGGVVALPLLVRIGRLSRLEAQAVSLAMRLPPIALPAVWLYAHEQGGLPWELPIAVAIGYAGGAGIGGRLAARVPERPARTVYALTLLALATLILLRRG